MKKLVLFLLFPSVCWGAGNVNFQAGSGGGSVVIQAATSSGGGGGTGDVTDVNAGTGIIVANPTGPAPTVSLDPNATNYIHNQNTLQSGTTAYPDFVYVGSSLTVGRSGEMINGPLTIDRPDIGVGLITRGKLQFDPISGASILKLTDYHSVAGFSGIYSYDYNDHLIASNGITEVNQTGNYTLGLASFSAGAPIGRLNVTGASGKFTFSNSTGSTFLEMDPVANSSFTTPVVLSTLTISGLSAGVLHTVAGSSQVVTGVIQSTEVATNLLRNGFVMLFDGGGSVITTSTKSVTLPFACTLSSWTVLADQSGSLTVHISSSSFGTYPTLSNISTAGNTPSLTSQQKNAATPSGWGQTTFSAGDVLSFVVDTATTVTWSTITLWVTKT